MELFTRNEFVIAMENVIYHPARNLLDKKLERIMDSHSIRSKTGDSSFLYKGCSYSIAGYKPKGRIQLLDRTLYPVMEEWLIEQKELDAENYLVHSFLACLSMNVNSRKEIELAIPESIHHAIPKGNLVEYSKRLIPFNEFLESCSREIQLIRQRLLLNLIT